MTGALSTARLTLRPPEAADWPAYRAYRLSPRSTIPDADEEIIWTLFAAFFGHWALRGFGRFIAVRRDTGAAIGHFGPFFPAGHPERELTWTLWDAACEGQGYAAEAAAACRDHAFAALGWETAVSYIAPGNTRSQALAARLGAAPDPAAPLPPGGGVQVWRHHPAPRSAHG
jgi:RimJ/RimL family protein N-acetyltransferase